MPQRRPNMLYARMPGVQRGFLGLRVCYTLLNFGLPPYTSVYSDIPAQLDPCLVRSAVSSILLSGFSSFRRHYYTYPPFAKLCGPWQRLSKMANMTDWSGTPPTLRNSVHLGVWTNWSRGSIMGATLTLDQSHGNLLIALTAIFIGMTKLC